MVAPEVSIIIPAHNEEKYIEATLESIKLQNFLDYEVIVVANGCTDKTEELVKKHVLNESGKLRCLSLLNANVSVARNAGALNAQGKMLLFLDADTKLSPNSLQTIKENFTADHSVATTKVLPDLPELKYKLALGFKNFYNSTNLYQGCSGALICRKEDFQSVGGYNPDLIVKEHRKLTIKLKQKGKYTCLDTAVITSMRRFEEWGLVKVTGFWIKQWLMNYLGDLKKSEYEKVR